MPEPDSSSSHSGDLPLPMSIQNEYKGHPQPPPDEQLYAARNFLADEDLHRSLGFTDRINQIEEYAAWIEETNPAHDAALLNDVKVMLEAHRDWERRLKNGPATSFCCDGPQVPKSSTRLINTIAAKKLAESTEALGLVSQMRDDAPPFTAQREKDQTDFGKKLRKDVTAEPLTADPKKNLALLEDQSYQWALTEPAFIPAFMHPQKGLPTRGLRPDEPNLWFKESQHQIQAKQARPYRGFLPVYLKNREDAINALLGKGDLSSSELVDLQNLLYIHQPPQLREKELKAQEASKTYENDATMTNYNNAEAEWISKFRKSGVQLLEGPGPEHPDNLPGVFYVPSAETMAPWQRLQAKSDEGLLDHFLRYNKFSELNAPMQWQILDILFHWLPDHIVHYLDENHRNHAIRWSSRRLEDISIPPAKEIHVEMERWLAQYYGNWQSQRTGDGIHLRVLYPGEMALDQPGKFEISWQPIPPCGRVEHLGLDDLDSLEKQINNLLVDKRHPDTTDIGPQSLLAQVAPPSLRRLVTETSIYHNRMVNGATPRPGEVAAQKERSKFIEAGFEEFMRGLPRDGTLKLQLPDLLSPPANRNIVDYRGPVFFPVSVTAKELYQIFSVEQINLLLKAWKEYLFNAPTETETEMISRFQSLMHDTLFPYAEIEWTVEELHKLFVAVAGLQTSLEAYDAPRDDTVTLEIQIEQDRINLGLRTWDYLPDHEKILVESAITKYWVRTESQYQTRDQDVLYNPLFLVYMEQCRKHGFAIIMDSTGNFVAGNHSKEGVATLAANTTYFVPRQKVLEIETILSQHDRGNEETIVPAFYDTVSERNGRLALYHTVAGTSHPELHKLRILASRTPPSKTDVALKKQYSEEFVSWIGRVAAARSLGDGQLKVTVGHDSLLVLHDDSVNAPLDTLEQDIRTLSEEQIAKINDWLGGRVLPPSGDKQQFQRLLEGLWPRDISEYNNELKKICQRYRTATSIPGIPLQEELAFSKHRQTLAHLRWQLLFRRQDSKPQITSNGNSIGVEGQTQADREALIAGARHPPPYITESQNTFFRLAVSLRTFVSLSAEDQNLLQSLREPITQAEIMDLEDTITILSVKYYKSSEEDSRRSLSQWEQKSLKEADLRLLWVKLIGIAGIYAEYEAVIMASKEPTTTKLDKEKLRASRRSLLTEGLRQRAEIELNNLLHRFGKNQLSDLQTRSLLSMTKSLAPIRLRIFNEIVEKLWYKRLDVELTDAEIILLANLRQFLKDEITKWLTEKTRTGIYLDRRWFSDAQIHDTLLVAEAWKRFADRGEYDWTENELEDGTMVDWHATYKLLTRYIDNGLQAEDGFDGIFNLPVELQVLFKRLVKREERDGPGFVNAVEAVELETNFLQTFMNWYTHLTPQQAKAARIPEEACAKKDFSGKAHRRGIQRAAIELGLNFLATNVEQRRPTDRFRIVDIPGQLYRPPTPEVPMTLPLEPWKRPLEEDTFAYTKKLQEYRALKDSNYAVSRHATSQLNGSLFQPWINYNGPHAAIDGLTIKDRARERQGYLLSMLQAMNSAQHAAPRPLMEKLLLLVTDAMPQCDDKYSDQTFINSLARRRPDIFDQVPLDAAGLMLLEDLTQPSWDEISQSFELHDLGDVPDMNAHEFKRLTEFAEDLKDIRGIPLWKSGYEIQLMDGLDPNDPSHFVQTAYMKDQRSVQGIDFGLLKTQINTRRLRRNNSAHLWTDAEMIKWLQILFYFGRIHIDFAGRASTLEDIHFEKAVGKCKISRIPLSGHPENKYVVSALDAEHSAGVKVIVVGGKETLEVQYDANGEKGRPHRQPNKYEYFRKLAFRLGRDISHCMDVLALPDETFKRCHDVEERMTQSAKLKMRDITPANRSSQTTPSGLHRGNLGHHEPQITLTHTAIELLKIAPELETESGYVFNEDYSNMDETAAAAILQMQIIEESSNNWESRFPENEHVWNFATDRVRALTVKTNKGTGRAKPMTMQFFNMRRYPVCRQSTEMQEIIKASGPEVQEEPAPASPKLQAEQAQVYAQQREAARVHKRPAVRHIRNQRPNFPFGETPYQQMILSARMEEDLKDVPEFQPTPPPKQGFISRFSNLFTGDKEPSGPSEEQNSDRYGLPRIPPDWKPDSVSKAEKRAQMIEAAMKTPGMPKDREAYYTPDEVYALEEADERLEELRQKEVAWRAVLKHQDVRGVDGLSREDVARAFDRLNGQERFQSQMALGIEPFTGKFMSNSQLQASQIMAGVPFGNNAVQTAMTTTGGTARAPDSTTTASTSGLGARRAARGGRGGRVGQSQATIRSVKYQATAGPSGTARQAMRITRSNPPRQTTVESAEDTDAMYN